jgi:deoxyribodipyrimidine photo-lyase
MIQASRIHQLNDRPIVQNGRFVLYWMQASQRTRFNHALEYVIQRGNELKLPIVVCFGLMDDYPEANERHYAFMLQGLDDVREELRKRKVKFVIKHGSPAEVAIYYATNAAMLVCDRGYLRHQRRWRDQVADEAKCRVVQVESDVVVPVEVASDKREYAARTIRPRIHRHLKAFLIPLDEIKVKHSSLDLNLAGDAISLEDIKIDRSVGAVSHFKGGQVEAQRRLGEFVRARLRRYDEHRNEPSADATSHMSMYLHFGQISPLEIALAAESEEKYIEELVVRRELAMNFVFYTHNYDRFDCLPDWAKKTLAKHARDAREFVYSLKQLEEADTHDRWWNAAMREMLKTGYMHNYMRMYWGKKILEWSKSPRQAYEHLLHLNNKYFLDGRDPASYSNVGWIFGLHDRPWTQRKIFGTIRYMNAAGLERKFDMEAYAKRVESL